MSQSAHVSPATSIEQSQGHRRTDIQVLRAVAVLLVLLFHAGLPVPGGFLGVDIFFVISGFVVTGLIARPSHCNVRCSLIHFWQRRVFRLLPVLLVVVLTTVSLSIFLLPPFGATQETARMGVGSVLGLSNWVASGLAFGYFAKGAIANALLHTWSLSVEEQFYAVFGIILFALFRASSSFRGNKDFVIYLLAAVAATSFLYSATSYCGDSCFVSGFYSPFTRAWEFLIGVLLFLATRKRTFILARGQARFAVGVGFAAVFASALLVDSANDFPFTALPATLGTALVILAGTYSPETGHAVGSSRMLQWVGDRSYSIYLWHWPLVVFAVASLPGVPWIPVLAVSLAFPLSAATYTHIEQRFRLVGSHPSRKRALWLLVLWGAALGVSLLVGLLTRQGLFLEQVREMQASQFKTHQNFQSGCYGHAEFPESLPDACLEGDDRTGTPVYLVGDSNAAHWAEGIGAIAQRANSPFLQYSQAGCLVIGASPRRFSEDHKVEFCANSTARLREWLLDQEPGTVFWSSSPRSWLEGRAGNPTGGYSPGSTDKIPAYQERLDQFVQDLQRVGHEVVLIQGIPDLGLIGWDPQLCPTWRVLASRCIGKLPRSAIPSAIDNVRSAIVQVAQRRHVPVVDPFAFLCDELTCSSVVDQRPVYWDSNHLSVDGSRALADRVGSVAGLFVGPPGNAVTSSE